MVPTLPLSNGIGEDDDEDDDNKVPYKQFTCTCEEKIHIFVDNFAIIVLMVTFTKMTRRLISTN